MESTLPLDLKLDKVDAATGQKGPVKRRKRKRDASENNDELLEDTEAVQTIPKKVKKWRNKQRVLVFCARGVTFRARHLMNDLRMLLPHSRSDIKLDRKDDLTAVNEVCEMKNCAKCIFFEMKKKKDIYMWVSNVPNGPSAKFLVENVHTMDELKLTGNCLLGSRPLLSFDPAFTEVPHHEVLKELFSQVFSTPYYHPKSKPFVDHVFHFSMLDQRIWFRNYQISEDGTGLSEIGPRFVLNLIKVFEGSFGGATLYENPNYITPNTHRRLARVEAEHKYKKRVNARRSLTERREQETAALDELADPLDGIFSNPQ